MNYRYPGPYSFDTSQYRTFFGRTKEIEELYRLIKSERITVLHGKSGLGKTSLIQAGLIKRDNFENEFDTVLIRFHAYMDKQEERGSPLDTTFGEIRDLGITKKIAYPFILKEDEDTSLWYFLKHHLYLDSSSKEFLLVFDQFEELFTYPTDSIFSFASNISEILYTKIPRRFNDQISKFIENPEANDYINYLNESLRLRIVFVIRSDKTSFLNYLEQFIPNIHNNTKELLPLSPENAKKAITMPAQIAGDYLADPFKFTDKAAKKITDYLTDNEMQPAESFQLSRICRHLEELVIEKGLTEVTSADIGNLDKISENYYENILDNFEDQETRIEIQRFIENGLILESENRRLSLYEGQIFAKYRISKEQLLELVKLRIISSEPDQKGGLVYELSHDSLVVPVLKAKSKRILAEEKEEQEKLARQRKLELDKRERVIKMNEKILKQGRILKFAFFGIFMLFVVAILYSYYLKKTKEELYSKNNDLQKIKQETLLGFAELNAPKDATLSFRLAERAYDTIQKELEKKDNKTIEEIEEIKKDYRLAQRIILESYNDPNYLKFNYLFDHQKDGIVRTFKFNENRNYLIAAIERNEANDKIFVYDLNTLSVKDSITGCGFRTIKHLSISDSGQYVLVSGESTVYLYNFDTKKGICIPNQTAVNTSFLDPEEKYILTATKYDSINAGGYINIYDMSGNLIKRENILKKGEKAHIIYANFINNGLIVAKTENHRVKFYEFKNKEFVSLSSKDHAPKIKETVSLSHLPGGIVVAAYSRGRVYINKVQKNGFGDTKIIKEGPYFLGPNINRVSYINKYSLIIAVKNHDNLVLYDTKKEKIIRRIPKVHNAEIRNIEPSNRGEFFLTAGDDHNVILWDYKGNRLTTLPNHNNLTTPLWFSKSDGFIVTSSERQIRFWHMKKRQTRTFDSRQDSKITSLKCNSMGKVIITFENGSVQVYDYNDLLKGDYKGIKSEELLTADDRTTALIATPDFIFTNPKYKNSLCISKGNQIYLFNLSDGIFGQPVKRYELKNKEEIINSIDFFPNGSQLIGGTSKGNVWEWRNDTISESGVLLWNSEFDTKGVRGAKVLQASNVNNRTGSSRILFALISPENHLLLKNHSESIENAEFISPIMSYDNFDVLSDTTLIHHRRRINLIKASRDQSKFLTTSEDRTIKVYRINNGRPVLSKNMIGHLGGIKYANFSPDGNYIVSSSDDNTVKVWETKVVDRPILTLTEEIEGVEVVELSADNKYLLMGTDKGTILIKPVSLDVEDILENINRNYTFGQVRNLSADEKKRFFGEDGKSQKNDAGQ